MKELEENKVVVQDPLPSDDDEMDNGNLFSDSLAGDDESCILTDCDRKIEENQTGEYNPKPLSDFGGMLSSCDDFTFVSIKKRVMSILKFDLQQLKMNFRVRRFELLTYLKVRMIINNAIDLVRFRFITQIDSMISNF